MAAVTDHNLDSVTREANGAYTSRCLCGWEFTGPNSLECTDIDVRKNRAYDELANHVVNSLPVDIR